MTQSPGQSAAGGAAVDDATTEDDETSFGRRVLPASWMRGLLVTVTAVLAVVLALTELTSAWVVLVLPLVVVAAVAYLEALDRIVRP